MRLIYIPFTIFIFFLTSCESSSIIEKESFENGNPKIVLKFKSIRDSTYTELEYFMNGKLKSSKDFVNAKLHGKIIKYDEKGFKTYECDYLFGKKNGIGTAWYESGKIAYQFKYKNDLFYDGTEYFEDGWPRVLVKFSAPGQREGEALYFNEDGKLWQKGYFKNGLQDSIWTTFNAEGNLVKTEYFNEGKRLKTEK